MSGNESESRVQREEEVGRGEEWEGGRWREGAERERQQVRG